jgi:hypothetical protein
MSLKSNNWQQLKLPSTVVGCLLFFFRLRITKRSRATSKVMLRPEGDHLDTWTGAMGRLQVNLEQAEIFDILALQSMDENSYKKYHHTTTKSYYCGSFKSISAGGVIRRNMLQHLWVEKVT